MNIRLGVLLLTISFVAVTARADWKTMLNKDKISNAVSDVEKSATSGSATTSASSSYQQSFNDAVKDMNQKCGTKITATFDMKSEPANSSRAKGTGYSYCQGIIDGVVSTCDDIDARPEIPKRLKTINCSYEEGAHSKTEHGGPIISSKDGVMTVKYDWDSANMNTETSDYIMDKL